MTADNPTHGVLLKGPAVSRAVFGGVLDYDGAGHYPGIELLNFVFGTPDDVILPSQDAVRFRRRAHDFARMLVWDEENFPDHPKRADVLYDDQSEEALRKMLECLQLEIPGSKNRPSWERAHLFPYTRSLIHWDARKPRKKGNQIQIERRYLRGGGALAFKVLRKDPDDERLERCRAGFRKLYEGNEDSALERLARVLAAHGHADEEARPDDIEPQSECRNDELDDLYRDGTCSILEHTELASVVRIRALLRWTAFWLVLVQHSRAAEQLGQQRGNLICDCGSDYAQLRRASQRCLKEMQALVVEAAVSAAEKDGGHLNRASLNKIRGFFWASAATIGLLNAWRGRRHFTLGIETIETLVMATTGPVSEMSFEEFVSDWLFGKYGLVVGRASAERAGLLMSIDASVFEDNENKLARQMAAAGLLTTYSDATRMVGTGGLR
jgi:hypothetical protein